MTRSSRSSAPAPWEVSAGARPFSKAPLDSWRKRGLFQARYGERLIDVVPSARRATPISTATDCGRSAEAKDARRRLREPHV